MTTPTKKKSKSRTSLSSPLSSNSYTHIPAKDYVKPSFFTVCDAQLDVSHIPHLRDSRCYMNVQDLKSWNIQAGDYCLVYAEKAPEVSQSVCLDSNVDSGDTHLLRQFVWHG